MRRRPTTPQVRAAWAGWSRSPRCCSPTARSPSSVPFDSEVRDRGRRRQLERAPQGQPGAHRGRGRGQGHGNLGRGRATPPCSSSRSATRAGRCTATRGCGSARGCSSRAGSRSRSSRGARRAPELERRRRDPAQPDRAARCSSTRSSRPSTPPRATDLKSTLAELRTGTEGGAAASLRQTAREARPRAARPGRWWPRRPAAQQPRDLSRLVAGASRVTGALADREGELGAAGRRTSTGPPGRWRTTTPSWRPRCASSTRRWPRCPGALAAFERTLGPLRPLPGRHPPEPAAGHADAHPPARRSAASSTRSRDRPPSRRSCRACWCGCARRCATSPSSRCWCAASTRWSARWCRACATTSRRSSTAKLDDGALSSGRPVWQDFLHGLVGLTSSSQSFDANGLWMRYLFAADSASVPAPDADRGAAGVARARRGAAAVPPRRAVQRPAARRTSRRAPAARAPPRAAPRPTGRRAWRTSAGCCATAEGQALMRRQLRYHGKWLIAIAFFAAARGRGGNLDLREPAAAHAARRPLRAEGGVREHAVAHRRPRPAGERGRRARGRHRLDRARGRALGRHALDRGRPAPARVPRRPRRAAAEHPARGHADRALPGPARGRGDRRRGAGRACPGPTCRSTRRSSPRSSTPTRGPTSTG